MSRDDDSKRGGIGAGSFGDAGLSDSLSGLSGLGGSSGGGGAGGSSGLEREPDVIVLDIGTHAIKAGWSGEDAPRCVVPTLLLDNHAQPLPAAVAMDQHHLERNEYAVGHAALQALHLSSQRLAGNPGSQLALLHPVERGEIKDYDSMQKILDHIFKTELRVNPKDHPVMLTVSPLCSPESRMELAKLMFDVFAVPALCMANQAVLSLYSTGRTTGVVLELGEGMSYCVPVYEGFALRHAVLSIPIAGADVTRFLMRQLADRGVAAFANAAASSSSSGAGGGGGGGSGAKQQQQQLGEAQADTVRDIKERLCRVKQSKFDYNVVPITASNAATAVAQASSSTTTTTSTSGDLDETSYELPSGQMIRLDDYTRFNTLEILFAPHTYAQAMGMHHLTGGSNQGYGIPPQQQSAANTGGAAAGGGGQGSSSMMLQSGQTQALSSPGVAGGPPSSPPTPSTAGGSERGGNNPPGTASGSRGGDGRGGLFGSGGSNSGGPISIDLSTNDLLGVHTLIASSVNMCDAFLRKDLLKNIVLAGGTSMAKGFGDRMKRELNALLAPPPPQQDADSGADVTAAASETAAASSSSSPTLNVITDSQRKYAAWIGASMYASLPTFGIIKITSEQYKRDESIVHKKFF